MEPKTILKVSKRKELDIIAVTDHETIEGGLETLRAKKELKTDLMVIVGAEIPTDIGDVIGLFLNKEIASRELDAVVSEIREQDGLVLLPHPFVGHNLSQVRGELAKLDLVELLNSRHPLTSKEINIVKEFRKRLVGFSDAHFPCEIGLCRTMISSSHRPQDAGDFRKLLVKAPITMIRGYYSPRYLAHVSEIIKFMKMRHFTEIPFQFLSIMNDMTMVQ